MNMEKNFISVLRKAFVDKKIKSITPMAGRLVIYSNTDFEFTELGIDYIKIQNKRDKSEEHLLLGGIIAFEVDK